jgi:hypothetical protein
MTEQEEQVSQPQQFLLTVDEIGLAYLTKMVPSIRCLKVEGLSITDQPNHYILVTPRASQPETDLPVTDEVKND